MTQIYTKDIHLYNAAHRMLFHSVFVVCPCSYFNTVAQFT